MSDEKMNLNTNLDSPALPTNFGDQELYFPISKFESLTNIGKKQLAQLGILFSQGIPLLQVITTLWKHYAYSRATLRASGVDEDVQKIKILQEHEKLTYFQIKNQKALGQLIEKDIAKSRMLNALSGYQLTLLTMVKNLASHHFSSDSRENEEFITNHFNGLVERILEDQVEIKEWEEDGSVRLLSTNILKSKEETDFQEENEMRDTESYSDRQFSDWDEELEDE